MQVRHFDRYWSNAKMKGFEVSTCSMQSRLNITVKLQVLATVSCFLLPSYFSLCLSFPLLPFTLLLYPLHLTLLLLFPSPLLCLSLTLLFLSLPLFCPSAPLCPFSSFPRPPKVYVVELMESIDLCVERNIHNRTRGEIEKVLMTL